VRPILFPTELSNPFSGTIWLDGPRLTTAIPGDRPLGALRASNFDPVKIVESALRHQRSYSVERISP
jgi:hypothetical protein